MAYRILHFADLHLDRAFHDRQLPPSVGVARRTDLRATLGRIMSLARERKVDAVTIAGDLYDQENTLPETVALLAEQFGRLSPVPVIIAPGETDPFVVGSLYQLTRWPSNVTIFNKGTLSSVEVAPGLRIWGAACPPARGFSGLQLARASLPAPGSPRSGIDLLLLHAANLEPGQVAASSGSIFTLDAGTASALGFAFALLGHEHKGYIWPEERPICAYPGTPELFSEGEASGLHGALLLTLGGEDEMPRVEHIPLAQWRYLSATVDLDGCTGRADAANQIRRALPSGPSLDEERLIVTATLEGVPHFDLDQEALREELGTRAHVRFDDHTALPYDLEQLAQEPTIRGLLVERFIRRVEAAQSEHERRVAEQALKFALAALDGKPVRVAQPNMGAEVQSAR